MASRRCVSRYEPCGEFGTHLEDLLYDLLNLSRSFILARCFQVTRGGYDLRRLLCGWSECKAPFAIRDPLQTQGLYPDSVRPALLLGSEE